MPVPSSRGTPIRTAIAGLGRAGWDIHVSALKSRPEYQVVACIDPLPERRAEAEKLLGCKTFAAWDEFLNAPREAELAIIATATRDHVPMSLQALDAGFHVLCEKPMAADFEEAGRIFAAAKAAKTVYMVNQNYRCNADLHQALSIINSGILGRVHFIKLNWSAFARRNDWQTLRKNGGGTLNNTCPHSIDTALQLLQSPVVDVWGDLQAVVTAGDADDHVKIMLRGANGRVVDHEVSNACAVKQPKLMVMGSLGTLIEEGDDFLIRYLNPAALPKLAVDDRLAAAGRRYGVAGESMHFLEKRVPARPPELQLDFYTELYRTLREGAPPLIKPEEVYEQMRVNHLARRGTRFE